MKCQLIIENGSFVYEFKWKLITYLQLYRNTNKKNMYICLDDLKPETQTNENGILIKFMHPWFCEFVYVWVRLMRMIWMGDESKLFFPVGESARHEKAKKWIQSEFCNHLYNQNPNLNPSIYPSFL